MTEEEKKARAKIILENAIEHPRMAWDERIVMPSDKKDKKK